MLDSELRVCLDSLSGETGDGPKPEGSVLCYIKELEQYKKETRVLPRS
jgi:hypothetical protein